MCSSGPVPIAPSLSSIYTSDALPSQRLRWTKLLSQFERIYSTPATFVSRSPGRVNLIGEHIDYSLYGVLPMAIAADALLAVSVVRGLDETTEPEVDLVNLQPDRFPQRRFSITKSKEKGWDVTIDASVLEWTNYFKSGLRGALALLQSKRGPDFKPLGMKVLMDGTVPVGGGHSSSAAFVSASALAVLYANGETSVDKTELTELAIVSERAVGVNSGGMDQSASVLSVAGSALHVEFAPALRATSVKMPETDPELVVLIAQTFVKADKHVTGPVHYNLRVVECSLAAAYLNAELNGGAVLAPDSSPLGISLRSFHEKYFAARARPSHSSSGAAGAATRAQEDELKELIAVTEKTLTQEHGYTREEVTVKLGTTVDELERRFTSRFPVRAHRFKLRQRALHVFTEALRVLQFLALLRAPAPAPAPAAEKDLGTLMDASHRSCRLLYDCSCPELDHMCAIARRCGSLGSRLTGAGWGGCSVHLLPADRVPHVKAAWETEYYATRALDAQQMETAVVLSRPGSGSALWVVANGASLD